jgi:hypothetical protein
VRKAGSDAIDSNETACRCGGAHAARAGQAGKVFAVANEQIGTMNGRICQIPSTIAAAVDRRSVIPSETGRAEGSIRSATDLSRMAGELNDPVGISR